MNYSLYFLILMCLWNGYSCEAAAAPNKPPENTKATKTLPLNVTVNTAGTLKLPDNMKIPAVFAFGDSIADQGANNILVTIVKCNFPPYGDDVTAKVPTGRFCNGLTPPDLSAIALGVKSAVPAYTDPKLEASELPTGVSFASGGAGYDPETALLLSVTPMTKQLLQFKEYLVKLNRMVGKLKAKYIIANAMVLVIAGSDDVANTYFTFGLRRIHYDFDTYSDLLASHASEFYKELIKLGVRRIGVFGVPPVGCVPFHRTLHGGNFRKCAKDINDAAQQVNSKLGKQIDIITKNFPDARIRYIDIYTPFLDMIQHPQKFGFDEVETGCCGTGKLELSYLCNKFAGTCRNHSSHLFWDSFHPSERGYKILVHGLLDKYISEFAFA